MAVIPFIHNLLDGLVEGYISIHAYPDGIGQTACAIGSGQDFVLVRQARSRFCERGIFLLESFLSLYFGEVLTLLANLLGYESIGLFIVAYILQAPTVCYGPVVCLCKRVADSHTDGVGSHRQIERLVPVFSLGEINSSSFG